MKLEHTNVFIKDFTLSLNVSLALYCDFTVGSKITSVVKRHETWSQPISNPVLPFTNIRSIGRSLTFFILRILILNEYNNKSFYSHIYKVT